MIYRVALGQGANAAAKIKKFAAVASLCQVRGSSGRLPKWHVQSTGPISLVGQQLDKLESNKAVSLSIPSTVR